MDCRVGCATSWEARIVDRFTGRVLDVGPAVQIVGGRVVDVASSGQAVFPKTGGADCCRELGFVRPWRYELEQWRCGVRVWVGPIVGVRESASDVTVIARDRLIWALVRRLAGTGSLSGLDASVVIADILTRTVGNPTDPVFWRSALRAAGSTRDVSWSASAAKMGWDVVKPLLGGTYHLSMVDDVLHGGRWAQPDTPVTVFAAADLDADLESFDDGFGFSTSHTVRGQSGVFATAGGADVWWGLIETVSDRGDLAALPSLSVAATQELDVRRAGLLTLEAGTSGQLMPGAPIGFDELIPHRRVRVVAPDRCRAADGGFRLGAVSWAIGGGASGASRSADGRFASIGSAGAETIKVSFESGEG